MLPELVVEFLAENEDKKERNAESRGLLNAERGAAFFLCESDESDEPEASLPERGRATEVRDDGPTDLSASEMSCKPWPRLDIVRPRSTSALRQAGVLAGSVKSGVPGPRSSTSSTPTCRDESVVLVSCETGMVMEETDRVRARLA